MSDIDVTPEELTATELEASMEDVETVDETTETSNEEEAIEAATAELMEEMELQEDFVEEAEESEAAKMAEAELAEESIEEPVEETEAVEAAEATEEILEEETDEEEEFIPTEQLQSIIESMLFSSDKPVSISMMKAAFKKTSVNTRQIRKAIDALEVEYASAIRGVTLEQVSGGYQLRTKVDNLEFLKKTVKMRAFRLSGPAMEVMAVIAYKQPVIKAEVDEIRGVESGHVIRALMEKGLVCFAGKSELPGKPMLYGTTKKFLETFSLKSLKDLPSLSEIDEILPEGIGDDEEEKETLSDLTASMSEEVEGESSYSQGEGELLKITDQLDAINTSSDFFEQEKQRQKEKREAEKARDLQEALTVGEEITPRDQKWLDRYIAAQEAKLAEEEAAQEAAQSSEQGNGDTSESGEEDLSAASTEEVVAAEESSSEVSSSEDSTEETEESMQLHPETHEETQPASCADEIEAEPSQLSPDDALEAPEESFDEEPQVSDDESAENFA